MTQHSWALYKCRLFAHRTSGVHLYRCSNFCVAFSYVCHTFIRPCVRAQPTGECSTICRPHICSRSTVHELHEPYIHMVNYHRWQSPNLDLPHNSSYFWFISKIVTCVLLQSKIVRQSKIAKRRTKQSKDWQIETFPYTFSEGGIGAFKMGAFKSIRSSPRSRWPSYGQRRKTHQCQT